MNFRAKLRQDPAGFQMAPMIDVVFLLLCFFVTSQIFAQWETEIDITLPTAQSGRMPQRLPGEVIVNILADGGVVVNGRPLDGEGLSAMMARLVEVFPGQPIVLRADRATPYEQRDRRAGPVPPRGHLEHLVRDRAPRVGPPPPTRAAPARAPARPVRPGWTAGTSARTTCPRCGGPARPRCPRRSTCGSAGPRPGGT